MMHRIAEGAEAEIYAAKLLGRKVIVKYRPIKRYREKELDEELRKQRTKVEARIQAKLYNSEVDVPAVIMVGKYWIAMERIDGETLNRVKTRGSKKWENGPMRRAMERAGEQLGRVHSLGVVHGDFTPANLMLDKNGRLWIIDFGLSIFSNSDEERALDLLLMKRSVSEGAYSAFMEKYEKALGDGSKLVLERLKSIEKRGRYQSRTLDSQISK
ncbi:MAG: KEOPS complex kinase/ATPase Bud32 [Candidatus Micrarchaeaceae archaeon]